MRRLLSLLSFLAAVSSAHAIPLSPSNGGPTVAAKAEASAGDLHTLLIITAHEDEVFKEWTSTSESHAPRVPTSSEAKRGETLSVLLFFGGCGSVKEACGATVDYKVLKPNGETYADLKNNQVWNQGPGKVGLIYLSPGIVRIQIESTDPVGSYTVLATFREPSTGKVLNMRQNFRVVE